MHRFQEAKQVSAYVGVVSGVHESGESKGSTRITKRGNAYLRGVMTEGMWSGVLRKKGTMHKFYLQIYANNPKNGNKAILACVNKALRIIWTITVRNETYKGIDLALYHRKIREYRKMAGLPKKEQEIAQSANA